jgi:MscS family membrane protein
LLRIVDLVRDAGTGFASSTHTLYRGRDAGPDREKTSAVQGEVQKWRDAGKMPFPDFAPDEIAKFRDSIPYPPQDSAVGGK